MGSVRGSTKETQQESKDLNKDREEEGL